MSSFDFTKRIFGSGAGLAFKSQSKMMQMCMVATLVASGGLSIEVLNKTSMTKIIEDRMETTVQALKETGQTHGITDILTLSARANNLFEEKVAKEPDSIAKETISVFFNIPKSTQEVVDNSNINGAYGAYLQAKTVDTIGYVENGANEDGAYGEYISEKKSKSPSTPTL